MRLLLLLVVELLELLLSAMPLLLLLEPRRAFDTLLGKLLLEEVTLEMMD